MQKLIRNYCNLLQQSQFHNSIPTDMLFPLRGHGFIEKTEPPTKRRKREEYHFHDAQTRLNMAKSSLLIGVNITVRKFSKQLGMKVNESTVRGMKKAYLLKLIKGEKPSTLPKCQGRNVLGKDKAKIIEKK